jgi:tetratricopeptide (TPR) repeat protein
MPKKSSFVDLSEAHQFINEGKIDEARTFLLEHDYHIAAQLLIAKIDTKSNPEEAINYLKEKISLLEKSSKPNRRNFCRLYAQMISCYLAQEDLESAEKIFKNISHYEKFYAYHRAQAEILEYKKEYVSALNKLHFIIETFHSSKQNDRVLSKKASLLELVGKKEDAEHLYDRHLKETKDPKIRLSFFYFLIRQEKLEKAERVLQKLLKICPNYEDALLARETHFPDFSANNEKQSPPSVNEPSPPAPTAALANSNALVTLILEKKGEETEDENDKAPSQRSSENPFVAVKKRKKPAPSEQDFPLKEIDKITKELDAKIATTSTSSQPPKRDKRQIRARHFIFQVLRELKSSRTNNNDKDPEEKIRPNNVKPS